MRAGATSNWLMQAVIVVAVLCTALSADADTAATVDNFRLTDHRGESHELYYRSDLKAVVLSAYGAGCESRLRSVQSLRALQAKYQARGVDFLLISSSALQSRDAIAAEAAREGISIPILMDTHQIVGESLGLATDGEAMVIDTRGWKRVYSGAVKTASAEPVAVALEALLAGTSPPYTTTPATGCPLDLPDARTRAAYAGISYERDIAPTLIERCVPCHRPGGIGPWSMNSYETVRGFAPMIREVLRTQRMPPWHSDPHYGVYSNDRGLTAAQLQSLVHWVEAGAPRGGGTDPLTLHKKEWATWALGEPDLVIELPPFTVPATGVIPYQMVKVVNPSKRDAWVRAMDYAPGAREVLHHVVTTAGAERFGSTSLHNYVPGAGPMVLPPDTGILLSAGSTLHFQMHYATNGRQLTDTTRFGLYFMNEPPKYPYLSKVLANPLIKIPPHAKSHSESAAQTFDTAALIYSLQPHAHFRGKSARFVARYPDGREEVLLNVPRYDFNWQSTYELATPKSVPAGTRILYTATYDNSAQNAANPDPQRMVTWGEQSWDEMVFATVRYRDLASPGAESPQAGIERQPTERRASATRN